MTHPNPSTALARVIVDELAVAGATSIFLSPGSRSGALAIAAAEHPEVEICVVLDERSAAFHALGAARASDRPAVVICTSGTAPANFFPAIVEADMGCVPLVAISADRPAELRGVGANQTIDQVRMFGGKVRAFEELAVSDPSVDENRLWRTVIARLVARARGPRPGPVHLNAVFREPTVPVTDDGRTTGEAYPFETTRIEQAAEPSGDTVDLGPIDLPGGRGVIVAGDGEYDRAGLSAVATDLGWPVLATAMSGMRAGQVVSAYGRLLARGVPDRLVPRTVVAVGAIGPDDRLEDLVAVAENRVRVDRWGRAIDPRRNATHRVTGDPVEVLSSVRTGATPDWAATWAGAGETAREESNHILEVATGPTGGAVASALNHVGWGALVVASSLPIREVDAHLDRGGPVFANRGASGIDGLVSTAFGVASAHPRTLALTGDLSLLHDSNGFIHDREYDLTIVVIDNEGGGLFDSLPQARHAPLFDRLFVMSPGRDLGTLARLHGARFVSVDDMTALIAEAETSLDTVGVHVIRVPVDRRHDLDVRSQLAG